MPSTPSLTQFLAAGAAALALCTASMPRAATETQTVGQLPLEELRTFADVYNQIREGYVNEVDDSTLLEYAIQGMLTGLDPHSVYLTEDDFSDLKEGTSGEFSGLGLEVGMKDGYVTVIAPIDGSPAADADLQSGDVILKLDNVPIKGLSLGEAIDKMRGPKGSEIELTIGRPGTSQPFTVTLKRDTIRMASVRERWLEPGYGYIRIAQFQLATGEDVARALDKLQAKGPLKGLVLDLRNNPGGVLSASVDVAGLFLDGGPVVYTEGRLPNSDMDFDAQPGDASDDTPLVVLINAGSASASEIVAGALQDRGRAIVMGSDSFGKGSVQTILPLSDSRAVKLTTALYFTPNGRSIQAEGIVPDIPVERARVTAYDHSAEITEADLSRHLSNGNGTRERAESGKVASELLASDNQLYEALTLLKGINILGMRQQQGGG
ncbi:MAG: S41 family peptidase [Halieaceae bacterium]|nr:S41 family peptidase [Halieaceae bacterium]MCP5163710.1 S41 family peptidase [Pseudomonadales bacterium]